MTLVDFTRGGPETGGNFEYAWQGEFLEAFFLSDVGKKREHNEDSCILCAPRDDRLSRQRGLLFAVADGMGGASGGERASALALQTIAAEYYGGKESTAPHKLKRAVSAANTIVLEEARDTPRFHGMGTTVSAVVVFGDYAYIAQVGDSRVYLIRNGRRIQQVTLDHSLVAEQVRCGLITEKEAETHSLKNLITRAVGTKDDIEVDLFAVHLEEGDTLLACSDGLSNMVTSQEMLRALRSRDLGAAARQLIDHALESGAPDNATVGLIRVSAPPPKTRLQEGATLIRTESSGWRGWLRQLFGGG